MKRAPAKRSSAPSRTPAWTAAPQAHMRLVTLIKCAPPATFRVQNALMMQSPPAPPVIRGLYSTTAQRLGRARASRSARGGTRRTARPTSARPFWVARGTAASARAGSSRWTAFACRPEQERRQLGAHQKEMERAPLVQVRTSYSPAGATTQRRSRGARCAHKQGIMGSVLRVPMDNRQLVESVPRAQPDARSAVAQVFVLIASLDTFCLVLSL